MNPSAIIENFSKVTVGALLAVILVAGNSGYWVFGGQYEECKKERDEWHGIAVQALHLQATPPPGVVGMLPPSPPLDRLKSKAQELEEKHVPEPR